MSDVLVIVDNYICRRSNDGFEYVVLPKNCDRLAMFQWSDRTFIVNAVDCECGDPISNSPKLVSVIEIKDKYVGVRPVVVGSLTSIENTFERIASNERLHGWVFETCDELVGISNV